MQLSLTKKNNKPVVSRLHAHATPTQKDSKTTKEKFPLFKSPRSVTGWTRERSSVQRSAYSDDIYIVIIRAQFLIIYEAHAGGGVSQRRVILLQSTSSLLIRRQQEMTIDDATASAVLA